MLVTNEQLYAGLGVILAAMFVIFVVTNIHISYAKDYIVDQLKGKQRASNCN